MKKSDMLEGLEYVIKNVQECYENVFIGEEKWLVISEMSREELLCKYKTELKAYEPWIYITLEQYAVMVDFERNKEKHRRRDKHQNISYDDNPGLLDALIWDESNLLPQEDDSDLKMMPGMSRLTDKQRRRMIKHDLEGYSYQEIAEQEDIDVTGNAVGSTVRKAHKHLREAWIQKYGDVRKTREVKNND